jgi:hypothetical protein
MARKKVVTEETFDADEMAAQKNESAEIALNGDESPIEDELAGILGADDSEDIKYTVHKMPGKPGERIGYCNTYTRGDLSLDTIRSTFGGGQYRITGRNSKNQYVTSKQVTLIDLPKAPGTLNGAGASADLAAVLQAAKGDGSNVAMIMQMFKAQSDMMTAILSRPSEPHDKGPSVMEIIAMIKTLQPEKDSGNDAVKMLMQGLELGQKLGGGGETGMLDIAKQGLEMIGPLVAREASQPKPAPRPNPQPQIQQQPAPAALPQQEAPNPMMQKLMWLRQLTATLIVHAVKQHDPETYAEVVLDNLPSFITEDEILERMKPDNVVAQLAQLNPQVTQHAAWFEEFRQAVILMLTPDEDDSQIGAGPGDETGLEP